MLVEQLICRKVLTIFSSALPNVAVVGNWLPSEDGGFKGESDISESVLHIRVSPRGYDSFTSKIAEFKVEIDGSIRIEEDTNGSETFACCEKIMDVLSGWQNDIIAVKRDLAVERRFDPVGFRMDSSGSLDIADDTLTRTYNHSFTLKGRIIQ